MTCFSLNAVLKSKKKYEYCPSKRDLVVGWEEMDAAKVDLARSDYSMASRSSSSRNKRFQLKVKNSKN